MDQGLIPRRYAKALYEVAAQQGQDARLYQQMRTLAQAFEAEPALNATLNNPFVSDADKRELIITAAGTDSKDQQMDNLLRVLEQNGRLGMVRDIAIAYLNLYRKAHNIYRVEVISAAPLAKDDEERLKKLIQSHLGDASMEYSHRVDPDLIGGFVVNIDNERLDASVKNDLKQLRLKLLQKA